MTKQTSIKTPPHCIFLALVKPRPLEVVRCDRMNAGGAEMMRQQLEQENDRVKCEIVSPPEDAHQPHTILTFTQRDQAAIAAYELVMECRLPVGYDEDSPVLHVYDSDATSDQVDRIAAKFGAEVSLYE